MVRIMVRVRIHWCKMIGLGQVGLRVRVRVGLGLGLTGVK